MAALTGTRRTGFAICRAGVRWTQGPPEHAHVYVRLDDPLTVEQHSHLCRALGDWFDADDHKISDNDLMRLPGTWNFKPRANDPDADPLPVTWAVPPARRAAVNRLCQYMQTSKNPPASTTVGAGPGHDAPRATVDLSIRDYREVREALAKGTGDRSEDTMRIVGACAASFMTLPQVRWVIDQRTDLRERLNERKDDDVARCWNKVMADRRAANDHHAADRDGVGTEEDASSIYVDVVALLDGSLTEPPKPEFLRRGDGVPMIYTGEVNGLFGDPQTGKTWIALALCAEKLRGGGSVLVADLDHNGRETIVGRLLMLGAPRSALADRNRFRLMESDDRADILQMVADCVAWKPDVVLIDSVGELLPVFNAASISDDDYTAVHKIVFKPLASAGIAVVLIDHLAKNIGSRSFGPTGAQAKRRTVGGAYIRVVTAQAWKKGIGGASQMWINKDRHGGVTEHCPVPPNGKKEVLGGTFILGAVGPDGLAQWQIAPPSETVTQFRPTALMERVSRYIERNPEVTKTNIAETVTGKNSFLKTAVDLLFDEGYLDRKKDGRYDTYGNVN